MNWLTLVVGISLFVIAATGFLALFALWHEKGKSEGNLVRFKKLEKYVKYGIVGVLISTLMSLNNEIKNAQNAIKDDSEFKATVDSLQSIAKDSRRANDSITVQLNEGRIQFASNYAALGAINDSLKAAAHSISATLTYSKKIKQEVAKIAHPISTLFLNVSLAFDVDSAKNTIVDDVAMRYHDNDVLCDQRVPQSMIDFQSRNPVFYKYLLGILAKMECMDSLDKIRALYVNGYKYQDGNRILSVYLFQRQVIVEMKITLKDLMDEYPEITYEEASRYKLKLTVGSGQLAPSSFDFPWHLQKDFQVALRNEVAVPISVKEIHDGNNTANASWRIAARPD